MRIEGYSFRQPAQQATSAHASPGQSAESRRIMNDVNTARSTALSALHNERFSAALDQLFNPAASDTMMQMRGDGGTSTDQKSVLSSYADNS